MEALRSEGNIVNTFRTAEYVCLFGLGTMLNDCFEQISLLVGRRPDFLCDNSPEKWGKEFYGIKCIPPHELEKYKDQTAVLITIKDFETVSKQLHGMGLKNVFISCFDRSYTVLKNIRQFSGYDSLRSESSKISVSGKWTLVTGAARGVGKQIAVEMAKLGSNIIAHSRSVLHSKEIASVCADYGIKALPVAAELKNLNEVNAMITDLENLVPQLDVIFNNAAISPLGAAGFWSMPEEDFLDSYIVNAVAPIRICQHFIPKMIKQGFGRIINITSSIQKRPAEMAYACSKASLNKFVFDLAPSLEDTGVMVTLADPGWLRTDMGGEMAPHAVESVIPGVLLGALLDGKINGRWFDAQDYAGLSIDMAVQKAKFLN